MDYIKESRKGKNDWEYWMNIYLSEENLKFNKAVLKNAKKWASPHEKSYLWLTLSPDKYLRNIDNTPENLKALNEWCEKWFDNFLGYGEYTWVIENGSEGDHLHVHAILEMKSSHKHAEKLKKSWKRHFPNHELLTSVDATSKAYQDGKKKGEYCYANFKENSVDKHGNNILEDKLKYLENEKKGSHENLSDTGFRGFRGFLSDNINETL